jgi:hypothetical protein
MRKEIKLFVSVVKKLAMIVADLTTKELVAVKSYIFNLSMQLTGKELKNDKL